MKAISHRETRLQVYYRPADAHGVRVEVFDRAYEINQHEGEIVLSKRTGAAVCVRISSANPFPVSVLLENIEAIRAEAQALERASEEGQSYGVE